MGGSIILNQNKDPEAVDSWAIVTGGIVTNIVMASLSFIQSSPFDFDYAIDVTVGGQTNANIGCNYDSINNVFSVPTPPILSPDQNIQSDQTFGAELIRQVIIYNSNRTLTNPQRLQLQTILLPIAVSLMMGALQNALTASKAVTVDGVLVTQDLVNLVQTEINNYLLTPGNS